MNTLDLASLVEPRLNSTQTRWIGFSSAARPFGMVNASPDTRIDGDWGCGYDYRDPAILGFSHIHEWQIGALLVMPIVGQSLDIAEGPNSWRSEYSHDDELVEPGYHRVVLARYGVTSELTATSRVVLHRHHYPEGPAALVIDLASSLGPSAMGEATLTLVDGNRIEGSVVNEPTIRRPRPLTIYFVMQLDRDVRAEFFLRGQPLPGTATISGKGLRAKLTWEDLRQPVEFKIAFSYTSVSAAGRNLVEETGMQLDFDGFQREARDDWNRWLGRVEVEGGGAERRSRFYTDMYFSLLGRRTMSDVTGTYVDNTGPSPIVRQIPLGPNGRPKYRHFNSDSFWGAQWTITPFWSLVCPEIIDEFCQCFMDMYRNGGLIPRGPSGGNYTFVMTSAQTTPLFVHAILAGIYQPDSVEDVYQALRKNHGLGGLMSKAGYEHETCEGGGLRDYLALGYIPEDIGGSGYHRNGASLTLEHAYNDACLAELAAHLGHVDDAAEFRRRSGNYRNLFDASIGLMRPRRRGGAWLEDYDPFGKLGWTEAGGWNYTFYVPHDVEGLIGCFGSRDRFFAQLERCLELSASKGFVAPHGHHEATALDFGNEPALGVPGLFHAAGKPERTQYWLRRILNELKSGNRPCDGYGGDEDQGMMGAWNVMVAMGLFTVTGACERLPELMIVTPCFERVVLHHRLPDGTLRDFVILQRAEGTGAEAMHVQGAVLNGRPLGRLYLTRNEIVQGGTLVLETTEG